MSVWKSEWASVCECVYEWLCVCVCVCVCVWLTDRIYFRLLCVMYIRCLKYWWAMGKYLDKGKKEGKAKREKNVSKKWRVRESEGIKINQIPSTTPKFHWFCSTEIFTCTNCIPIIYNMIFLWGNIECFYLLVNWNIFGNVFSKRHLSFKIIYLQSKMKLICL